MRYAFTFDASACTGCKTCQVACKDKHALPRGVLWRRVYEVSGGGWQRRGAAWTNNVFAYNVSVACNHCVDPACVRACPTGACAAREDGIVSIDGKKCVGCEYCAWACPYSAPQYSRELGRTTKCDFCRDLLDAGLPPSCVAACPMRALDFVRAADLDAPRTAYPYPLPTFPRSRPQIQIKAHRAMSGALPRHVANREEVRPGTTGRASPAISRHLKELPLVAFTLLGQAAAGTALVSWLAGTTGPAAVDAVGALALLAALASLLHLGTASGAWRATANAGTSALSREILALGVFAAAWVLASIAVPFAEAALAVAGVALVYSMAQVYAIEGIPGWTRWRIRAAFGTSTIILGAIGSWLASRADSDMLPPPWTWVVLAGVLAHQALARVRFYQAPQERAM